MKAIILAAGLGSRLGVLTREAPKAVVSVSSQPLVVRAVNFTRKIGVDEIVVIGGYNSDILWETLANESVIQVENPDFRKGNLYTLAAAHQYLTDDFVLMNIDHLYPTHLARMISETTEGVWAVSDFDRPLFQDDMKIQVTGDLEQGMWIQSISKELDEYDGGYCGVTVVRGDALKTYLSAFENVMRHRRDQAVVEDVLAYLAHSPNAPKVLDISGIRWLEVDTQEDLANAERILRMKPHFLD